MKLLIYSDLHNEFRPFQPPPQAVAAADVVVLAGDIHEKGRAVLWAQQTFPGKPVVLVAGNHDFYGGAFFSTVEKMRAAAKGSNVHFLEDQTVVIHSGKGAVRFLGCTLWTDMRIYGPMAMWQQHAIEKGMPDYRATRNDREGYRRLLVRDTVARHQASRTWLEQELTRPFEGKTVVVTHHAPSEDSVHPRFRGEFLTPAFASCLNDLVAAPVDLWIHGHMHDSLDYRLNGTRVVCNPRGYIPEEPNRAFREGALWEI